MADFPLTHRIVNLVHYHQAPNCHPNSAIIPAGLEIVELVTAGRGWIEHEGDPLEVVPGDLLWHVAGDQTIGRSDFTAPYRCLAVRFEVADTGRRRVPRVSRWPEIDVVRGFTREVVEQYVDEQFDRHVVLLYVYSRLLLQARRHHHRQWASETSPGLQRVLTAIDSTYAEPLRLQELAALAGWSVPHLHAVFRDRVGVSPHQFLIQRRMQAAKEWLASTDRPVKQIASDCGYSHEASFCRQFRRATGLTPGTYRRQNASYLTAHTRQSRPPDTTPGTP